MSVRKREWTTAKGEAKTAWVVDYFDGAGKRRLKTFAKKKEADAFSATARVEVAAGAHTPDSASISVKDAADKWLTSCESRGLEVTTVAAYRQHVDLHIVPYLGRIKLSQITAPMVRAFEDAMRKGEAPFDAPRSPAMVKRIRGSLSSLISDAQERGLVSRNVVRDLRARRNTGVERRAEARQKGRIKAGVDIPTPDEIRKIVAEAKGRWRPLLLTAIFAGLRSSEIRGLRWADVDLNPKASQIHVRQRADRYKTMGAPKSAAGERTIPIPQILANALREWKLQCPKGEIVFPNGAGNVELHQNIVNRGWKPTQLAAGVITHVLDEAGKPARDEDGRPVVAAKYSGMHAMRHFFASWLINRKEDGGLGLPAKVVQERLGHSTIGMTLDVYGHLFPREDHAAELAAAERILLG
jgi:integrase